MGKTVEIEALDMTVKALSVFILSIQEDIEKIKFAAVDCSDNMDSDEFSKQVIMRLGECTVNLSKSLQGAEDLRQRIIRKKRQIEELGNQF